MKNFGIKLKLILVPYLTLFIAFIGLYTFLDWVLIMRTGIIFSMSEFIPYAIIPYLILWIPLWIWIKPRAKLLIYSRNGAWFYVLFMMSMGIGITNGIIQAYVETTTGKVTPLNNIDDISTKPKTRYYTLKTYYIDTVHIGIYNTSSISGKQNQRYHMNVNMVMPVLISEHDTASHGKYWIGKQYGTEVDNSQFSDADREKASNEFESQCLTVFHQTNFNQFIYLRRVGVSGEYSDFLDAIQQNRLPHSPEVTILEAINQPFALRSSGLLSVLLWIQGMVILFVLFFILFTKIDNDRLHDFKDRQSRARWKYGS